MQVPHDKIRIVFIASCLVVVALIVTTAAAQKQPAIDLSGEWRFALDRAGEGLSGKLV
jgi:hypothetical protein